MCDGPIYGLKKFPRKHTVNRVVHHNRVPSPKSLKLSSMKQHFLPQTSWGKFIMFSMTMRYQFLTHMSGYALGSNTLILHRILASPPSSLSSWIHFEAAANRVIWSCTLACQRLVQHCSTKWGCDVLPSVMPNSREELTQGNSKSLWPSHLRW